VAGAYRLQDYADDIIAFLRQQVFEPAVIFGHSLGGMVALLVAAQCPEKIRAVVVGDSPLTAAPWLVHLNRTRDDLTYWRDLAGGAYSVEEITEALADERLGQNLYQTDPDMLTILIDEPDRAATGYDMAVVLPSIRCPVLLLQADPKAGGVLTDAEVEQGLPLLSQPTHVLLEGVSHVLHNEQKEPVLQAITDFLTSL
jgi:pimeloyl-ACP methyl ester carboxylesterase